MTSQSTSKWAGTERRNVHSPRRATGAFAVLRERLAAASSETGGIRERIEIGARAGLMLARGTLTISGQRPWTPVLRDRGVRLMNRRGIELGAWVVLERGVLIQGRASEKIRLARGVTVGEFSVIRPSGYYGRLPGKGLTVGLNSNIGARANIGCVEQVTIGSDVLMGPGVSIYTSRHVADDPTIAIKWQGTESLPVRICDGAWIGGGCHILPGVTIGNGAVVAAGSVVNEDVPPLAIVAGVPARVVKYRGATLS